MQDYFRWPTPAYFEFPADADSGTPEPALLVLTDGRKVFGTLIRFLPGEAIIELQLKHAETTVNVALGDIHRLDLMRPLCFKKRDLHIEEHTTAVFQPADKQKFTAEFRNGGRLAGETAGFVAEKYGLFLFLPSDREHVMRCFFPTGALASYQIGDPLGEILISENIVTREQVEAGLQQQEAMRNERIGDQLAAKQIITPEQLQEALERQKKGPYPKLGEVLIQENLITPEQLDEALRTQQSDRKVPLGQILVRMGVVDQDTIKRILALKMGVPFVYLRKFNIDPNAVKLVPDALANKYKVMPLYRTDAQLVVAMENTMNPDALDELRFCSKLQIVPVMASVDDIAFAISNYYGATIDTSNIDDLASALVTEDGSSADQEEAVAESDNTLVRLVNKIILDGYQQGASDIHIETYPGKQNTVIRFRKDGTLFHYFDIPANFRSALISRIKIMCHLDISERRKPQDGKIDFQHFGPAKIELRVATIPTTNGMEDIVMRILAAAKPIALDNLGLRPDSLESIKKIAVSPYGLLLICGPTGSGKTTTLHSVLGFINTPERKIWTAEDPIEITQAGLRQVQMQPRIGWTFAAAMRSFLRADPDVIMVGEMRDQETTKIGIEASLTGHMVLSTLHTNSAPESVVRLLDLGMDPFNFADALRGILAQRLAKRACKKCATTHAATKEEIDELLHEYCEGMPLDSGEILKEWRSNYADKKGEFMLCTINGCPECDNTGYRGRIGLHELLVNSNKIKKQIQAHATVEEILTVALAEGMRTLKQDGIEKVLQGFTDIHQIRAVSR